MIKDFMDLSMEDKIKIISLGLGVLGFLTNGENCLYNGTNENYECACDECDYFIECFGE